MTITRCQPQYYTLRSDHKKEQQQDLKHKDSKDIQFEIPAKQRNNFAYQNFTKTANIIKLTKSPPPPRADFIMP